MQNNLSGFHLSYYDLSEYASREDQEKYYFDSAITINQVKLILSKFDNIYSGIYINSSFGFSVYDQTTGATVAGNGTGFSTTFSSPDFSAYVPFPTLNIPSNSYVLKPTAPFTGGNG